MFTLIELRLAGWPRLISYQDYHMLFCRSLSQNELRLEAEAAAAHAAAQDKRAKWEERDLALVAAHRSVLGSWVAARRLLSLFLIPYRVPHGVTTRS